MKINKAKSKQALPEYAKKVFDGVIFDVYQWEQELYDGSTTTFEKLKRPDTVMVIPVTEDRKIILTKQEQPGKSFIGLAGGRVDEGEELLDSAKRELLEETGYEAQDFVLFDVDQPYDKIICSVYTYIARGCKKEADLDPGPGEKIEVIIVEVEEFFNLILDKDFRDTEVKDRLISDKVLEYEWNNDKLDMFKKELMDRR